MSVHLERFDLDMPDDFPAAVLERIQDQVSEPEERRQTDQWREWAGACNGILYRFRACAEHSDRLATSLAESTSPPQPERYVQWKLIFGVFVEGLSAVECAYFGSYFLGALIDARLDSRLVRSRIEPRFVTERFEVVFADEALTASMRQVVKTRSSCVARRAQYPHPSRSTRGETSGRAATMLAYTGLEIASTQRAKPRRIRLYQTRARDGRPVFTPRAKRVPLRA